LPGDMQDRLAGLVENWGYQDPAAVLTRHLGEAGCTPAHPRIRKFAALWTRLQDLPRHLGQHSGGMVIAAGRLDDVVPLEPATMPGRVVIQWDKDDCAALGIVKVDLLGLRMMSVLQDSIRMVGEQGGHVDLAHLPPDDAAVYAQLQQADTIGVFQVESRAQMATLPRIHPERFYDLVVQVAIIRPGPIVGDMVHPYIRRRRGRETVTYPHPSLEPILARTLGVPLFQEQLLRTALGRQLVATAEHPLLTDGGWRGLAALQPGDRIAAARALPTGVARFFGPPDRQRLDGSEVAWDRVTALEPVGERETYDLEI